VLVVQAFRHRAGGSRLPSAAASRRVRLVATVLALFVYALVLESGGFLLSTFLLMIVVFRIEPLRWPFAIGGAAAAAVLSQLVFKTWLGVRLPPGPWGF